MAIATDFSLNYTTKKISYIGSGTRYTVRELYSHLMDLFDDASQMDDTVPMSASTPTEFSMINGWTFNSTAAGGDLDYLYGGSIVDTTTSKIWANFYTLGTIAAGSVVYWQQNGALVPTYTGYTDGHCDQLIETTTHATVTAFIRNLGDLYDFFSVTATATGGRNPVPLATSTDSNDTSATASDGGVTAVYSTTSHDTGIGGAQNYAVVVDGNGLSCANLYKALKYITRRQNTAAIGTGNATTGRFYQQAIGTTPVKAAPFGTFAGGKLFGAQGVWITNVSDQNNIAELYDSSNTKRTFPVTISVSVSNVAIGDRVLLARSSAGVVNKSQFTIASVSSTTIVATTDIPQDVPQTGVIRVGDTSFAYTSWTSPRTFNVTTTAVGQTGTFYIPLIDKVADATSLTAPAITYVADFDVIARVRKKGILPFENTGTVGSTGLTVSAIRTADSIAV